MSAQKSPGALQTGCELIAACNRLRLRRGMSCD